MSEVEEWILRIPRLELIFGASGEKVHLFDSIQSTSRLVAFPVGDHDSTSLLAFLMEKGKPLPLGVRGVTRSNHRSSSCCRSIQAHFLKSCTCFIPEPLIAVCSVSPILSPSKDQSHGLSDLLVMPKSAGLRVRSG